MVRFDSFYEGIAQGFERFYKMGKVDGSSSTPPSTEWVHGDKTGEIKAARNGTGDPTSHTDGS